LHLQRKVGGKNRSLGTLAWGGPFPKIDGSAISSPERWRKRHSIESREGGISSIEEGNIRDQGIKDYHWRCGTFVVFKQNELGGGGGRNIPHWRFRKGDAIISV